MDGRKMDGRMMTDVKSCGYYKRPTSHKDIKITGLLNTSLLFRDFLLEARLSRIARESGLSDFAE